MKKVLVALLTAALVVGPCSSVFAESVAEAPEGLGAYYDTPGYEVINEEGTASLNDYYAQYDIECDMGIRSGGPDLMWTGGSNVPLPEPAKQYKIGFSVYYTVDEVGAMYLAGMQDAAKEIGIDLLINDADYDQNNQNQAIEQWILEGVDAVIMTACDFYACKDILDQLHDAGIPVVTLDAPPCAGEVDAVVMYDCVEQGKQAADALIEYLNEQGSDMEGTIYYGTLPFIHPNALTREYGFIHAFDDYPNVEIKPLTGESPEDHYTAFDGILGTDEKILGLWGLYDSATFGILNVCKANGYDYPITSIDNDRILLEGIYNGDILGSSCYSAIEGSRLALAITINLLNGEKYPSIVYQGNTFVTQENAAEAFEEYYNGATLEDYMAGNE